MDAPGQVPQLDDGLLGPPVGVVDQLAHLVEVDVVAVGQLLLGLAEPHGQRHQLGLGAVVEVALDPAQGGGRGVDGLGPGLLEASAPGPSWRRGRAGRGMSRRSTVDETRMVHGATKTSSTPVRG